MLNDSKSLQTYLVLLKSAAKQRPMSYMVCPSEAKGLLTRGGDLDIQIPIEILHSYMIFIVMMEACSTILSLYKLT